MGKQCDDRRKEGEIRREKEGKAFRKKDGGPEGNKKKENSKGEI